MTLNQLEYFCAVCRYHSITRAAESLFVWVCQEFCVNFFRNLYHTSTLIRSYDHL